METWVSWLIFSAMRRVLVWHLLMVFKSLWFKKAVKIFHSGSVLAPMWAKMYITSCCRCLKQAEVEVVFCALTVSALCKPPDCSFRLFNFNIKTVSFVAYGVIYSHKKTPASISICFTTSWNLFTGALKYGSLHAGCSTMSISQSETGCPLVLSTLDLLYSKQVAAVRKHSDGIVFNHWRPITVQLC